MQEYRQKNKIRLSILSKKWKEKNPDKARKIQKKYYAKNREKLNQKATEWGRKNRERIGKRAKVLREMHPEKYIARYKTKRMPLKSSCEICSSTNSLQRHHWRYDKPSMFSALCRTCHTIQHVGNFYESIYGGILKL